jgi:hypothetical protein
MIELLCAAPEQERESVRSEWPKLDKHIGCVLRHAATLDVQGGVDTELLRRVDVLATARSVARWGDLMRSAPHVAGAIEAALAVTERPATIGGESASRQEFTRAIEAASAASARMGSGSRTCPAHE